MIVADASLLAHLLIPSPDSAVAEAVYRRDAEWSAPILWRSELSSVLLKHVRHSGMKIELAKEVFERARLVIKDREARPAATAVLEMAVSFKVSAYDAAGIKESVPFSEISVPGRKNPVRLCRLA